MATDNKYDRQIRLWGQEGQQLLNKAHICLINATATGTETLKSLVLGGIGAITIVDSVNVTERDLGNNFFVKQSDIGRNRATATLENLLELNQDVTGNAVTELKGEQSNLIQFLKQFQLVFINQTVEKNLTEIVTVLEQENIPFVITRSYGMIGYIRISKKDHCIVQSKPADTLILDLRLNKPFQELQQFVDSINLEQLQDIKFQHTPYVVLLLKAKVKWLQNHQALPSNFQEKQEFSNLLTSMQRSSIDQNFLEAKGNSYCLWTDQILPGTQKVLELAQNPPCETLFWKTARAVKQFYDKNQVLPLSGSLPDMHSDSDSYIKLQNMYKNQSLSDQQEILKILNEEGAQQYVQDFVRNIRTLDYYNFRSYLTELNEGPNREVLEMEIGDDESLCEWYILLRAVDKFYSILNRFPTEVESDAPVLKSEAEKLARQVKENAQITNSYVEEMIRYGGIELHNIAAVVGAVASQEALKLITSQFIPIDNTFIFDGAKCRAQVLSL